MTATSGYQLGRDAVDGLVYLEQPVLNLGTATVTRVVTDQPDDNVKPRPVGFRPPPVEVEPQLWEGDDS